MSLSKTQICNMALASLGTVVVTNVDTDTSVEAIVARTFWDASVDQLLESLDWNFARKRYTLAQDATWTNEDGEYEYRYQLPSDCIRVRQVNPGVTETIYEIEGNYLMSNESEVYIRYTGRPLGETGQIDTTKFPPAFNQCLTLQLAANMATRLMDDKGAKRDGLLKQLQYFLKLAESSDAREGLTAARKGETMWTSEGR